MTEEGATYLQPPPGVYAALGGKRELMQMLHERFIQQHLAAGKSRIDLAEGVTIEDVFELHPDSFTALELLYLADEAPKHGYALQGNSWVLEGK